MSRGFVIGISLVAGLVAGWVVAGGVVLWSDDGPGGPVAAEWLVGIAVGAGAAALCWMALGRAADRHALGTRRRRDREEA
jgi:hypothetical protein